MLPGFNTNIRRRGVLFHVQTEDSGRARPHVITHLFRGGTILASEKSSYADRVDTPDLESEVRTRMESQHKAMLHRLRRGELDEEIVARLGATVFDVDPNEETHSGLTAPPVTAPATEATRTLGGEAKPATVPASDAPESDGKPIDRDAPLDELVIDWLVTRAQRTGKAGS